MNYNTYKLSDLLETVVDNRGKTPLTVDNGIPLIEINAITGDNAYPDDLTILSIELDNITNVETMFIKKFEVGARWFDDIVDNNRMYNDDYSDDYEDDDGMNY